jgi:hypothetical protein
MTSTQELTAEEIVRRGEAIYQERLRSLVETDKNTGKYVVIDIETGDYEVGDDHYATLRRAREKRPEAVLCGLRIGYSATGRIGGGRFRPDTVA